MTHGEAYNFLISSYKLGRKHDFDAIRRILDRLGNPQNKPNIVHVAGTNGKGSVCAMLSSILTEAGYRTGLYTSPHLQTFNERFMMNGVPIGDKAFAEHMSLVRGAAEGVLPEGDRLSYFELLTLLGFSWFAGNGADFLVLETGIGGLRDVTNVVERPALSVITSIGLDHMEYLGGSIDEITVQKAGIIKKNCPSVLYLCPKNVYNIVYQTCLGLNSQLYHGGFEHRLIRDGLDGQRFSAESHFYSYNDISLPLPGGHQVGNAHTALLAVAALRDAGFALDEVAVLAGMARTRWPGRMETLMKRPLFIADGAHNVEGAEAFASCVERYLPGRDITLVAGILRGKDYAPMLNRLAAGARRIILTAPSYKARALEPSQLYRALENKSITIITESDHRRAVDTALRLTLEDGAICCAGSLYLVGDVREYIGRGST